MLPDGTPIPPLVPTTPVHLTRTRTLPCEHEEQEEPADRDQQIRHPGTPPQHARQRGEHDTDAHAAEDQEEIRAAHPGAASHVELIHLGDALPGDFRQIIEHHRRSDVEDPGEDIHDQLGDP